MVKTGHQYLSPRALYTEFLPGQAGDLKGNDVAEGWGEGNLISHGLVESSGADLGRQRCWFEARRYLLEFFGSLRQRRQRR
jgi:hypothetical protein